MYKCINCDDTSDRKNIINTHQTVHKLKKKSNFKCFDCGVVFGVFSAYKLYIEKDDSKARFVFPCESDVKVNLMIDLGKLGSNKKKIALRDVMKIQNGGVIQDGGQRRFCWFSGPIFSKLLK
jgi:hypothetical protein